MKVTPEMRQAVHEEECAERGHIVNLNHAINTTEEGIVDILGPPGQIAYLDCSRCKRVWMVMEDPGNDYAHAELKLRSQMKNPNELKPKNPRRPSTSGRPDEHLHDGTEPPSFDVRPSPTRPTRPNNAADK